MMWRLAASRQRPLVLALGSAQTIAWGSSYYLPAVLATPIAAISAYRRLGLRRILLGHDRVRDRWAVEWAVDRPVRRTRHAYPVELTLGGWIDDDGYVCRVDTLVAAWLLMGVGMGIGLYESAFATLAGIYRTAARSPITGITLIAGFASTVACLFRACWKRNSDGARPVWFGPASISGSLCLSTCSCRLRQRRKRSNNRWSSKSRRPRASTSAPHNAASRFRLLCGLVLIDRDGSTSASSPRSSWDNYSRRYRSRALIGPAQVVARLAEHGLMQNFHP